MGTWQVTVHADTSVHCDMAFCREAVADACQCVANGWGACMHGQADMGKHPCAWLRNAHLFRMRPQYGKSRSLSASARLSR